MKFILNFSKHCQTLLTRLLNPREGQYRSLCLLVTDSWSHYGVLTGVVAWLLIWVFAQPIDSVTPPRC